MFEKERLLKGVEKLLERGGFHYTKYHGCFDIAAKRESLLLVKILSNVDSFQESHADNLKSLSSVLDANPIIIGLHTRASKLDNGVVYHRFSIPTVNLQTFSDMILKDSMPIIYSERGGLFIEVDSAALKNARHEKYTQEELAEITGVTKKNIYEHEARDMKAVAEVARKIQNILGEEISKPFRFVRFDFSTKSPKHGIQKEVFGRMKRIGFDVQYIEQSPLNIAAKEKVLLLSDVEIDRRKIKRDAPALKSLANLISSPAVLITERSKDETLEGIPIIKKEELAGAKKTKDVIKIVKERKE